MTSTEIAEIVQQLDEKGLSEETLSELRASRQPIRVTRCTADDLEDHDPYLERDGYLVYLLSSDGHCLALTSDLDSAVGLVFAER